MAAPLDPVRKRLLLTAASLNFVTMGAMQSLLGPSLESLGTAFAVQPTVAGLAVSMMFVCAGAAILAAGMLVRRLGYRAVLAGSLALLGSAALLVAVAPAWPLVLLGTGLMGLGFGLQNVAANLLLVRTFRAGAAPILNFVGALFGVGSVLGPLLVGQFLPEWRIPWMILGGVAVLAAVPSLRIAEPEREVPPLGGRLPGAVLATLSGFVVMMFLYVSAEVGVAAWEATHLAPLYGAGTAAYFTSLYWLSITAGRFAAMFLSTRVRPPVLVLGSMLLGLAGVALAHVPQLAPWAYMLAGFAFAPVFPTSLAWLQQALPGRMETFMPFVMAAANLGPVLTAPLIGWSVTLMGSGFVPTSLTIITLATVMATAVLYTRARTATA